MSTPYNATSDGAASSASDRDDDQEHLRPVRFTREVRLPLAVRKELLITRAALERYDCAQALHGARSSIHRMGRFASLVPSWLPGARQSQSWLRMLGLAKSHPMLSTAVSLAFPLLRKTPLLRWTWKASKLGLVAGAGYFAYQTWQKIRDDGPAASSGAAVPDVPAAAAGPAQTPTEPAPVDTGFRDPLVR